MKPRSAWGKIGNRLSSSFGSTSFSARALPRFRLISIRALSLASVLPPRRKLDELGEMSSLDMTVELPVGSSSSIIMAGRVARFVHALGDRQLQVRLALVENEHQVAEAQLVVFAEQFPSRQRPAVEQRAVAAVEVLDVELAVDEEDAGVLAADGGGVEDDVAFRVAAEGHAMSLPGRRFARVSALGGFEAQP